MQISMLHEAVYYSNLHNMSELNNYNQFRFLKAS